MVQSPRLKGWSSAILPGKSGIPKRKRPASEKMRGVIAITYILKELTILVQAYYRKFILFIDCDHLSNLGCFLLLGDNLKVLFHSVIAIDSDNTKCDSR